MKSLMTGNEAIARGAWEAGVRFATAYPGTPSTEILENIAGYDEIHSQWSVNEKTALETALGGSIAGLRTLCAMKHVGLNVAADPLFSSAYMGVNAGLVIITADDPGCHSSQNEQDNRNYAKAAKLPLIEPSNSQEALDYIKIAFELSEAYRTPVLFRITTRLAHGKSTVAVGERVEVEPREYVRDVSRFVLMPAQARACHIALEDRLAKLEDYACSTQLNRVEWGSRKLGIICSGVAYHYAHEVFGEEASYLKLGMSYPFPKQLVRDFAAEVDRLVVIEELDPFIEDAVRAIGIEVEGKSLLPRVGELDSSIVARAFGKADDETPVPEKVTG
ncbi:MAG: indolepyruvate ferredoxin oxidoreductase subunit alpha, partial [Bacillota bacterium]